MNVYKNIFSYAVFIESVSLWVIIKRQAYLLYLRPKKRSMFLREEVDEKTLDPNY